MSGLIWEKKQVSEMKILTEIINREFMNSKMNVKINQDRSCKRKYRWNKLWFNEKVLTNTQKEIVDKNPFLN